MKKKATNFRSKSWTRRNVLNILLLGVSLLFLSSCQKEYWINDGFDGRAFLALSWSDSEPEYIDPGTNAIPLYFYWDEYYQINPGVFTMYYDGIIWDNYGWYEYAWEVDYEIWINYGELGTFLYDGRDGADSYFVVECNPYGPYVYLDLKSTQQNNKFTVLEEEDDLIIIQLDKKNYSIKLTYRKVEKHKIIKQEIQK